MKMHNKKGAIGDTATLIIGTVIIFFILLIFYFITGELALQRGISIGGKESFSLLDFKANDYDYALLCTGHAFELFISGSYGERLSRMNDILMKMEYDYEAKISGGDIFIQEK